MDNKTDFNTEIVDRAQKLRIPVTLSRIDEDDLRRLAALRCDALIVAGYEWRIPDWREHLRYAANFPSLAVARRARPLSAHARHPR
ncbi:MAG: hypothetical protein WDN30_05365 [Pararobbsia sp.]